MSTPSFAQKSTIEKIDALNRWRGRLYCYGANLFSSLLEDHGGEDIVFSKIEGSQTPIRLYVVTDYSAICNSAIHSRGRSTLPGAGCITYPTNIPSAYLPGNTAILGLDADVNLTPTTATQGTGSKHDAQLIFDPAGKCIAHRSIHTFSTMGAQYQGYMSKQHEQLGRRMREQYESALLRYKKQKVQDLKDSLGADSVQEFLLSKKAKKTQAIMDIAMRLSSLVSKLENYKTRITAISTPSEAKRLLTEVGNAWREFDYANEKNLSSLNDNPKIPGGASLLKKTQRAKKVPKV